MGQANKTEKAPLQASTFTSETIIREIARLGANGYIVQITHQRLYLPSEHPDFINIYNRLKPGTTQRVTYSNLPDPDTKYIDWLWYIVSVEPCETRHVRAGLRGFMNISNEYRQLSGMHELVLDVNTQHRILAHKDMIKQLQPAQCYNFYYVKDYDRDDLYRLTKAEPELGG